MTIDNYNFNGKKAIVRVDFNVPLDENGKITDDTRIRGALPTLKKILEDGGALIIMSHMGKPKGKVNPKFSLSQIKDDVAKALGRDVIFAPDCAKADEAAANLKPGEVLLLENLRFYPEEEGKPVGIDKEDPAYEAAKKEMKGRQKDFAKLSAPHTANTPQPPLSPRISHLTTRCSATSWRKRLRLSTTSSATSNAPSLLSWAALRYLPKSASSRTSWTR